MIEIFAENDSKLSFTQDIWTSITGQSYVGIVASYITSNFELKTKMLAMKEISSHTGANIAEIFTSVLREYRLEEKIGFITMDNAANNGTFIEELEKNIPGFENPKNHQIRCMAHIINLVIRTFIDNVNEEEIEDTKQKRSERRKSYRQKKCVLCLFLFVFI